MSLLYEYFLPVLYNTLFIYILLNGLSDKKWIDVLIRLFVICPLVWSILHFGIIVVIVTAILSILIIYSKFFGENTGGN